MMQEGIVFALDKLHNLIKLDTNLLDQGRLALYKLINFSEHGKTILYVGQQRIWLLHASGSVQKILKLPFTGRLQLEHTGGNRDDYLLWKQYGHILAAINRFNVVSFWNTLTGEHFYNYMLEDNTKNI